MRRHGDLWKLVTSPENIDLAYRRARKQKTWQRTVQNVDANKDAVLADIRESLLDRTFTTSNYRQKNVYEPKKRTIYILPFTPDRIVQHALMSVVAPIWDNMFDSGSHACRPGKGQHSASRDVMRHIRKFNYVLQGDVKKFYPSIEHDIAMSLVEKKIKDEGVLWLFGDIIRSFPGDVNVPIGNYSSQWVGNLVMNELDVFVRSEIRPGGYVRYNDDFLIFGNSKEELHRAQDMCRDFLKERLHLTLSKDRVYPVSQGVDFVGYRHFRYYVLIRKRTARRVKQRIRHLRYELATGQIEPERARSVVASTIGWLQWANAHNFRQALGLDGLQEDICGEIQ